MYTVCIFPHSSVYCTPWSNSHKHLKSVNDSVWMELIKLYIYDIILLQKCCGFRNISRVSSCLYQLIHLVFPSVSTDSISINHKDSRWVGAWWLGFLATGTVMLLAGIPFWVLPRSLPKQVEDNAKKSQDTHHSEEDSFIPVESKNTPPSEKADSANMTVMAKGTSLLLRTFAVYLNSNLSFNMS